MVVIHFIEDANKVVLTQLVDHIPEVDANLKVKGRKGKVLRVDEAGNNHFHVFVQFEPIKKQAALIDKRKRR